MPLPQNRAVKTGRHDVSVVPATARLIAPKSVSWLVHRGREGSVTPNNQ